MVAAPQGGSTARESTTADADFFLVLAAFQKRLEALQQGGRLRPASGTKAAVRGAWRIAGESKRHTVGPHIREKPDCHDACSPPTSRCGIRRFTTGETLGTTESQAVRVDSDEPRAEAQSSHVAHDVPTTASCQETDAPCPREVRATSCGPLWETCTNSPVSPVSGSPVRAASCTRPEKHVRSPATCHHHSEAMRSWRTNSESDSRAQRLYERLFSHERTQDRSSAPSPATRNNSCSEQQCASQNVGGDTCMSGIQRVQPRVTSRPHITTSMPRYHEARFDSSAGSNNDHSPVEALVQPICHSKFECLDDHGGPAAAAFDFLTNLQSAPMCANKEGCQPAEALKEVTAERDELRSKLDMAESELAWRARSREALVASHETVLAALRTECDSRARAQAMEAAECARLREEVADSRRFRAESQRYAVDCARLREQVALAEAEVQRVRSALAEEKRSHAASRNCRDFLTFSPEAVAPSIAMMEVQAFRTANAESRSRLKRQLQLKWHPDKCINTVLATCVMQELQQRPEWG